MLIETCAKVNLTLEMVRRRDDGYHDLATVFQAIDICDRIGLSPADSLTVTVTGAAVPADETNLCHRAAVALAREAGIEPRVSIALEKRIPVGAGLGGGSGNAAGTLGALNLLWQLNLGEADLARVAAELGSDVPFFLRGGAALGLGRGEQLEPLPSLPGYHFLVLAPGEAVSTGAVYAQVTGFRPNAGEASQRLAQALRQGSVVPPSLWLVNDLEQPAGRVSAVVRGDRRRFEHLDLAAWRLSGSGGAWFVPISPEDVEPARWVLEAGWPWRRLWLARPVNHGWRVLDSEG